MTRSYKQLDILERQRIYFLRKQGFSLRKIAEDLSRSPSTILREVRGDEVRRVEGLLNGRPRKVLEYRTPEEVFKEALALGG